MSALTRRNGSRSWQQSRTCADTQRIASSRCRAWRRDRRRSIELACRRVRWRSHAKLAARTTGVGSAWLRGEKPKAACFPHENAVARLQTRTHSTTLLRGSRASERLCCRALEATPKRQAPLPDNPATPEERRGRSCFLPADGSREMQAQHQRQQVASRRSLSLAEQCSRGGRVQLDGQRALRPAPIRPGHRPGLLRGGASPPSTEQREELAPAAAGATIQRKMLAGYLLRR